MLDPQERLLYLAALRPPDGYRLDSAIATTFSLDLLSLLMAPLSMIFSEQGGSAQMLQDPTAFLEALRRVKDRLLVFGQAGRISVPTVDTPLYSYLEPVVTEVQPDGEGVFHPKLWFLRFAADDADEPVRYRLLCLSRNLTFDRSWDTLLSLDGVLVEHRRQNYGLNRPLVDFVKTLPTLALTPMSSPATDLLDQLAAEIGRVQFEPPAGFEEIVAFRPIGINGYKRFKFSTAYNRLLVVSPFLTNGRAKKLLAQGSKNILVARAESLDGLSAATLAQLQSNTSLYIMNEAAERPEPEATDEDQPSADTGDLSGLHAKLYVAENSWDATVLTGSANVSDAAFLGRNIEFMVELKGKRSQVGIEALLGDTNKSGEAASLRSLLLPYQPGQPDGEMLPATQRQLEAVLNQARQTLIQAKPRLTVTPAAPDTFTLTLTTHNLLHFDDASLIGRCYPISRRREQALSLEPLLTGDAVAFTNVSLVGLTGFMAFELTATLDKQQATVSFVLNLPVSGLPDDRDQAILRSIIADKNRFIRYLLFLLAEDKEFSLMQLIEAGAEPRNGQGASGYLAGLPLLEELVRAASRQPQKIERIAAVVDNLPSDLLPDGFSDIWAAFLAFQQQREEQ